MSITVEIVAEGLRSLGLVEGDVVLLHSGLIGLAPAREQVKLSNCGADLIIDAFLAVVGPDGIVSVPTHCPETTINLKTGKSASVYDPAVTPSVVGDVTNVLRLRAGAVRSAHPTHSIAAIGNRAAEFVAGHDTGSTFDINGPHGKLVAWGGKVCWFNTEARTHTMTHAVEQWMGLPYMGERDAMQVGPNGEPEMIHMIGFPDGARDFYKREGSKLSRAMDASGLLTSAKIGGATVALMDAKATCDYIRDCIIKDPLLLIHDDRPNDSWVQRARELTPKYVQEKFGEV